MSRTTRDGRTIAAIAVTACVASALGGCGRDDQPRPIGRAFSSHGLTVRLPAGWQHAGRSLTPDLADPREVLAVGTYALHYRRTACAHVAGSALADLGPADAFVTLQERRPQSSSKGFPARPAHFGPRLGGPSDAQDCVPGGRFADHWFGFSDGGRKFHVDVVFGRRATAQTRDQAWAVLDSLRVDPAYSPA